MEQKHEFQQPNDIPPAAQLCEIAIGFMKSQALYVAAKTGIADLLADGSMQVTNLARLTGVNEDSLHRLMRALSSIGIFNRKSDGCYENTPMSMVLRTDISISLSHYILLLGDKSWWNSWGSLLHCIKTGDAAFDDLFGMDYMEYLKRNPELHETFNQCMTSVSQLNNPAIVQSYDFSQFTKIVDIGGGHGNLLAEILNVNSQPTGILFDLPVVIASAHVDSKIRERIELIGGNFFENVPQGGDAFLLKQIIHDWSDEQSIKILKNCRSALNVNGRLLVIESVIDAENSGSVNNFFDLHMLVTAPGGRERTRAEFQRLFNEAGFELVRVIQTPTSFNIIEGQIKS